MSARISPQGWIAVDISEGNERWAKAMRARRDQQYGNLYQVVAGDERWVGDLGELVFDRWLRHHGVQGYAWVLKGAAGSPDFRLASGTRVGVKTVKRKGPPRGGYTAQITARHANEPIEQFFFLTYETAYRRMWLLGGIDKPTFLSLATHYPAGAQVHAGYTIREGHEIYNIDIGALVPACKWLEAAPLTQSQRPINLGTGGVLGL